jgi:hypothetical protein
VIVPDVAAAPPRREPNRWIHGARFDLAFFILSPLSGVAVVLAALYLHQGLHVLAAATYLVAIPHYLSTFTFYLGDDNRAHYRTRWLAFFLGPLLILGGVLGLRLAGAYPLVLCAMFLWNIYHVALQSAGILSIYRRLNGGPQSEKRTTHLAILLVSAAAALWHVERFAPLFELLASVDPRVPWLLSRCLAMLGAGALARLGFMLWQREKALSLPESGFLATSLLLFHPYLWVEDSNLATLAMLMGHFLQYLAIVWLLHRRKYDGLAGSAAQRLLGWVARRTPVVLVALAGSGVVIYLVEKTARALGAPFAYLVFWNALTLIHFYLDGLIWAFRNPFVRESLGAYLAPPRRSVAA